MRTKILLATAAALAAGVLASSAQVYSANVVGYYNVTLPANTFVLTGSQLVGSSNDLNTLMPSLPNKSTVNVWNGAGFTPSSKSAGGWSPDLTIAEGQGFWVQSAGSSSSNTFVGSVVANIGTSVTNSLTGGTFYLVASPIPYGEDLNGTNINLSTLPNKSTVNVWTGAGYTPSSKSAGGWSPDQTISVGQGFWVQPSSTANWVQTLH